MRLQLQREADREPRTAEIERGSPAAEPSNPFPQSEAPSGDGTGIKAGGGQAE